MTAGTVGLAATGVPASLGCVVVQEEMAERAAMGPATSFPTSAMAVPAATAVTAARPAMGSMAAATASVATVAAVATAASESSTATVGTGVPVATAVLA
ncbi:hypothetical protein PT015_12950 [Candidatus Mycobacterium wuenschmannii]|uniref:Secreted protein n=1 Tax=Candidatus Mycobacterium wuenschmannii TaxID=3027808 RepID=A0ABY8VRZ7_9MYCO|nr:hypothetical protein [Candidatus Mycobacterium wuenschmannii]WIM85856.1 hypothetical protein PT015_12950 [Candidatus Mycobacterium wuenschmannii]